MKYFLNICLWTLVLSYILALGLIVSRPSVAIGHAKAESTHSQSGITSTKITYLKSAPSDAISEDQLFGPRVSSFSYPNNQLSDTTTLQLSSVAAGLALIGGIMIIGLPRRSIRSLPPFLPIGDRLSIPLFIRTS